MNLKYPKKVFLGDLTIRDGFQHEEKFIPTAAKLWLAEELILCGFNNIEVTNLGNPKRMPQFADSDVLLEEIINSKRISERLPDVTLTAITIREKAIERAIELKKEGKGPDRILLMVSTSEKHQLVNSGLSLDEYWEMAEKYIPLAKNAGIKVNGTVSTIWGCPVAGKTDISTAFEFTKRWFDIGADDVEHADHDGSASPDKVYAYFSEILNKIPDPEKHIVHLHTTKGTGLANILAALQAGMINYESTLGGTGGQPATFVDGVPVTGTGKYYNNDPSITGLVSTEDMVLMMNDMGIDTGINIERLMEIGRMNEKIVGRRLRSEAIKTYK